MGEDQYVGPTPTPGAPQSWPWWWMGLQPDGLDDPHESVACTYMHTPNTPARACVAHRGHGGVRWCRWCSCCGAGATAHARVRSCTAARVLPVRQRLPLQQALRFGWLPTCGCVAVDGGRAIQGAARTSAGQTIKTRQRRPHFSGRQRGYCMQPGFQVLTDTCNLSPFAAPCCGSIGNELNEPRPTCSQHDLHDPCVRVGEAHLTHAQALHAHETTEELHPRWSTMRRLI